MWWKKHKWNVIIPVLLVVVLAAAFWYGGGAPGMQGWSVGADIAEQETSVNPPEPSASTESAAVPPEELQSPEPEVSSAPADAETEEAAATESAAATDAPPGSDLGRALTAGEKVALAAELTGASSPGVAQGDTAYSAAQGMDISSSTGKDQYLTDPVPEGKPVPVEPQDAVISDTAYTCTLSVRCDTILDNMSWLSKEKHELVPADGVIFPTTTVTFYEGESVFNVLQREMKGAKIHMEFVNTPMYNSAYIEGINNLYEFDVGELSGWMYQVNGWFPNYGCSRYQLQDGDVIEWVYTCNLGIDVGGYYAVGD
ncbi:MAG: DUF4430 domain-containing protein [Oscillospiraceae bacterium]|nr:DUF4430 domain-containing protein [Oscillospiraceae bacterium]